MERKKILLERVGMRWRQQPGTGQIKRPLFASYTTLWPKKNTLDDDEDNDDDDLEKAGSKQFSLLQLLKGLGHGILGNSVYFYYL